MLASALTGKPPRNIAPSLGAVLIGRIRGSGCSARIQTGYRRSLKIPNGVRKPARRDREVRVRDVVDLRVVDVLVDRPAVGSAIGRTLKLSFELRARLDQPAIAQRHQQDRVDLRVDQILSAGDETEGAGAAGKDGNRLFGVGGLGSEPGCEQKQKQESTPDRTVLCRRRNAVFRHRYDKRNPS